MKKEKFLTIEQRKIIEELNGKISQYKIALFIGKSPYCIYNELKNNSKPYNAQNAQLRSEEVMRKKMSDMGKKKYKISSKTQQLEFFENKEKVPKEIQNQNKSKINESFETRLRNIEFQIEIILDKLGEMKK